MAFRFTGFADEATKSLRGQIGVLKELGWTALETRLVEGKNFCDLSDGEFEAAWETLQGEGIAIVGYGSQLCNWARPITSDFQADLDELERNLPRMKKTGTKLIRCMSYPNDKERPLSGAEWKAEAVRRLRELARRCAGAGVILGHENCSGYGGEDAGRSLELIEAVGSPAFKIIFDSANTGNQADDPEASWEYFQKTKEHVCHVHIKSLKRGADGKLHTCFPDEDPIQARLLKALKEDGYEGYVSIEPHMKAAVHAGKDVEDESEATAIFLEYGRRVMKLAESV